MESTYENIKRLRESKGMSQDELAELTGYTSRSSIAKIEKGLVDLQQSKILAFANALGVTPGELMGIEAPQYTKMQLDEDEYAPDEIDEIRRFANYLKSSRKKKENRHYFKDVYEAVSYLRQETSIIATFNGDTANEEIIMQMADTVYLQRNGM